MDGDPPRLLIVDDNPEDRALIVRALRRRRPDVAPVEIPDQAAFDAAMEDGAFDLVVTDFSIRWTTGLDVLRAIRARYPDCPVVMFTGTGTEEVAVKGLKAGLQDYIVKSAEGYDEVASVAVRLLDGAPRAAPRVLLVDDDPAALLGLGDFIRSRLSEVVVEQATSSLDVRTTFAHRPYDVIVTDIKMPHVDGLALLREAQTVQPHAMVIVVTGHGDRDLGVRALEADAYGFVAKPIDREFFLALLKRAIRESRLRRRLDEQHRASEQLALKLADLIQERVEERHRLRALMETLGAGVYEWVPDTGAMTWSPAVFRLLGLDLSRVEPSVSTWLAAIHPEDRAHVTATMTDRVSGVDRFHVEYRLQADPQRRLLTIGGRIKAATGAPSRQTGLVMEVIAPVYRPSGRR